MESVHFYVTLKDDFNEKFQENKAQNLFDDLDNPYQDAMNRLTPGKIYPVMNVGEDGRAITVIDDLGRLWTAVTGLFKYAEN